MVHIPFIDYVHLLVVYIVCTIVRGLMLYASVPILNSMGHVCTQPVTFSDATVMCWGGLRGALGLALAIKVNVDCADERISPIDGQRVLFYVGGVALLTLMVNATTCPALVKRLRLNRPSGTKQMMMLNVHRQMSDFVAEEGICTGPIGEHLHSMLGHVEEAIAKVVDKRMVASVEKMCRDFDGRSSLASIEKLTCSSDDLAELTPYTRKTKRSQSPTMTSLQVTATGQQMIKKLDVSKRKLHSVPEEFIVLLDLAPVPLLQQQEHIKQLLEEEGEVDQMQLKPINDVFLSLVRAKYWAAIEGDEFIQGEGECLLDSISGAMSVTAFRLTDLHFMKRRLLAMLEDDQEVVRIITSQKRDSLSGTCSVVSDITAGTGNSSDTEFSSRRGCVRLVSSLGYNVVMVCVITVSTLNCIAVATTSKPGEYSESSIGEKVAVHVLFGIFLLDFFVRLAAYKLTYFSTRWRQLDAFLTVLCFLGILLEVLRAVSVLGSQFLGTPLTQVIRALTVMQLLRVHQLSKSMQTIRAVRKFGDRTGMATQSRRVALRLQTINILTAFTQAHTKSQEELLKYFGRGGKVGSGAVARCIADSITEVCDASYIAYRTASLVDHAVLRSLKTLRSCIHATEELCKLVEAAHQCGAMSEGDADSLLHPMKHEQMALREMVHDAQMGIIPENLMLEPKMVSDECFKSPELPCEVKHSCEKALTESAVLVDSGTQTEALEVAASAEHVKVGELQPRDPTSDYGEHDDEFSQSGEGWSVCSADELAPPPHPPVPCNLQPCPDLPNPDVRL